MKLAELPDRETLRRHARRVLRDGEAVGVIFIDLDGFKAVNDTKGHLTGDRCLQKVVSILNRFADSRTRVFRYGGDEFVIFVEGSKTKRLPKLAESVRGSIESGRPGGRLKVTASIGVARGGQSIRGIDKLLLMADEAAYVSKFRQKNCVTNWPIPLHLRNGARERRIEEIFAARHKGLLLRVREMTEAARQFFFHVTYLFQHWRDSAERWTAIQTLCDPSVDKYIKGLIVQGVDMWTADTPDGETDRERTIRDQLDRYKLECTKGGTEKAIHYVRNCIWKLIQQDGLDKQLILLTDILGKVNRSANSSSRRLKELYAVCGAVLKTVEACKDFPVAFGPKQGAEDTRRWNRHVFRSEKICAEASALIASFLPEMRTS